MANSTDCFPCPANWYLNSATGVCVSCPALSTGPAQSSSIENCTCPYGFVLDTVNKLCSVPQCLSQTLNNTLWPTTDGGSTANGVCDTGYFVFELGFPTIALHPLRDCILNEDGLTAAWDAISRPCQPSCNTIGCQHNGTCFYSGSTYSCICTNTGYSGEFCDILGSADCGVSGCLHSGFCVPSTGICDCTGTQFTGTLCQSETITCNPNPCANETPCTHTGVNQVSCNCNGTGYEGPTCADPINACLTGPCESGGTCFDVGPDKFVCDCPSGYAGALCQTIINSCFPQACQHNGICYPDGPNHYRCDCNNTGYAGLACEVNPLDCTLTPCQNGGVCNYDSKSCDCDGTEFTGPFCTEETVTCQASTCQNGGSCTQSGVNQVHCACESVYVGSRCEVNLAVIVAIPCAMVLLGVVYLILRRFSPQAMNSVVIAVPFAVFDFVTDILFLFQQSQDGLTVVFLLALLFVIVPLVFNMAMLGHIFFTTVRRDAQVERWLHNNFAVTAAVGVLATTNVESFILLASGLFNLEIFSAPLSPRVINVIRVSGLVSTVLEDIPQLAIQSYVARSTLSTITVLSIIASVFAILFSIFKRLLILLLLHCGATAREEKAARSESESAFTMTKVQAENSTPVF